MVEVYYEWRGPKGKSGIKRGRFLSYKHAYNVIALWNNDCWTYIPIWENSCQIDVLKDYEFNDFTTSYTHLG